MLVTPIQPFKTDVYLLGHQLSIHNTLISVLLTRRDAVLLRSSSPNSQKVHNHTYIASKKIIVGSRPDK